MSSAVAFPRAPQVYILVMLETNSCHGESIQWTRLPPPLLQESHQSG